MSGPAPPRTDRIRELLDGYRVTQAIFVAVTLGIPDLVAERPRTGDDLAAATGAHAETLVRLLRALAATGVLHEDHETRFSLTALGEELRTDSPTSVAGWAAYVGAPAHWHAWGALLHSVRTGENAFRHVHGTDVWDYRARHPEESALFDGAMAALTSRDNQALTDAFDFGRFATIADIGGGNGSLLAAVLAAAPGTSGIVFDLPHVASRAAPVLEEAGVADRCEVLAGSFFDGVPAADAYVLRSILHDWEDAEATAILAACRRSVRPGGSVLIVERLLGAANEDPSSKYSDLNMLVGPGGRERTLEQFEALLGAAGFVLAGATTTSTDRTVIEGTEERPSWTT